MRPSASSSPIRASSIRKCKHPLPAVYHLEMLKADVFVVSFSTYSSLPPLEARAISYTAPGSAPSSHRSVAEGKAANGPRSHLACRRKLIPRTRFRLWEPTDLRLPPARKRMMKAGSLRTTSISLRLRESRVAGGPRAGASSLNRVVLS